MKFHKLTYSRLFSSTVLDWLPVVSRDPLLSLAKDRESVLLLVSLEDRNELTSPNLALEKDGFESESQTNGNDSK